LLAQDLSLFIAHVNLETTEIKLYSVGAALLHSNMNDVSGLVVHLDPVSQRFEEGVLHTCLGDPVLTWTTADLANRDLAKKSYVVMKRCLELDRWNRRYRKMGVQTQIRWKTNDVPSPAGTSTMWSPARGPEVLAEVVPAIQMIAGRAISDPSLAPIALQLVAWMRDQGVEADPGGIFSLMVIMNASKQELRAALAKHNDADVAVRFFDIQRTPTGFSFWVHSASREGQAGAKRHEGSIADLHAKGFDVEVDPESLQTIKIGVAPPWLNERHEVIGVHEHVLLLRKVQPMISDRPEK
jgi:hypothetical protein